MLKLEAEHLRRELNEWHDRACIPRVEEPVRSESFSMVLHEELEVIPVMTSGTLEDEEDDDNGPHDNDIRSLQGSHDYAPIPSGGPLGIEEHQGMLMNSVVTGRPFPPAMSANRNFPLYNQQRPSFSHQPHSYPAFTSSHGPSPEGYVGPPVADTSYYGVTSEKYPNPPIQQYFDNLSFARRRAEANGRIRSNSIASMTSSGSASPPLYPYPHTQPQFEVGWARSQQHHPASVGKSGGIGNGPLLGMM
ncbi:hypothetical protein V5O48_007775 [Marasmius crinis-equi]|uniref:Uncharacterized protein n=1 Tax=Marasmius crinis-equi TaxID=585013 RepID=A0ABR3FFQ5_9AGAR